MAERHEGRESPAEIEELDIHPLSDEDLESVAGGAAQASCSCCDTTSHCTGVTGEAEE